MARNAFPSQNVKHLRLGTLLEIEMLKKCTQLGREARFECQLLKPPHAWSTFGYSNRPFSVAIACKCNGFCTVRIGTRRAHYFRQREWENAKHVGTRPSALHSQNCIVFDIVNVKNWGNLAKFFTPKVSTAIFLRKSRRIAGFWNCQLPPLKESSHTCIPSDGQIDRETDRQADRQLDYRCASR